jgi:hypothetical protein
MARILIETEGQGSRRGYHDIATTRRTMKPVAVWASLGAFFLALQTYVMVAWVASGNAKRTPAGETPIPGWMNISLRTQEVAGSLVALGIIYWCVIRPWRQQRTLSLDGMFVLSFLFGTYWQDPLFQYTQWNATYNTGFFNLGSWAANIPGWIAPHGNQFAEPLLFAMPAYLYGIFGGMVLINILMRQARTRWPGLSNVRLALFSLAGVFVIDFVLELFWMRLGAYNYAGAVKSLTLFHGHYYQFPVYEVVLWGGAWAGFAFVRFFRDDKGHTVAERGVEELRVTNKQKTTVRFLAIVGIMNVIFLGYSLSWNWLSLHSDAWPADIQNRSYFRSGLCGPGTDYACPGPDTPIHRRGAAHLDPDGYVITPARDGQ